MTAREIIRRALDHRVAVPAFNIPYPPMMEPVVRAARDAGSVAFVDVARLEWVKFEAQSIERIRQEYDGCGDPRFTRLHLDHIPVVDEDDLAVDYLPLIERGLAAGYDSVMIDGSRLSLEENIAATRRVCRLAEPLGIAVEGELGAVLGHEDGPLPPYEELYTSGRGFTDPDEAARFVAETGVDWLSIAFGNVHGAISAVERTKEKIKARLNIEHLARVRDAVNAPIVLHGGSGIDEGNLKEAIAGGVAKINIATDLRRPYEAYRQTDMAAARQAVYEATRETLRRIGAEGTAPILGMG